MTESQLRLYILLCEYEFASCFIWIDGRFQHLIADSHALVEFLCG